MALSFHVMFYYHDALLFRVPSWGLVFCSTEKYCVVLCSTENYRVVLCSTE